jgi:hypothetical protein
MIPNKMQLGEGGLFDSRGVAIIVSFRTSFEDPWTDSADYASPLVALTYRNNGFDVVTARYRVLISRDAADLLSEGTVATTIGHDPRGFLAAYMVDECELGRADAGWAALDRLNQLGELNPGIDGGPKGAAYVKNLVLVLHSQDYCTAGH